MVLHLPDARIAADAEFVTDQRRCIAEWSGERAQRLLTIILNAAADRLLDQMRQIRWPAEWVNLILFGSVCQMMSNHDVKCNGPKEWLIRWCYILDYCGYEQVNGEGQAFWTNKYNLTRCWSLAGHTDMSCIAQWTAQAKHGKAWQSRKSELRQHTVQTKWRWVVCKCKPSPTYIYI